MLTSLLLVVLCQSPDLTMSSYKNDDLNMSGLARARATTKRQLDFYGPTWCPICPTAFEDVQRLLGGEFTIRVHKDYEQYPQWVVAQGEVAGWGYPMLHWTNNSDAGQIMVWSGIDAFRKADGKPKQVGDQFAPTPGQEVERVIGLLPRPEIGFVDFGCGDARWCIAAAERWGCKVTGVEIDPTRVAIARERVRFSGLEHLITIIEGDATKVEVAADVGTAYLYGDVLEKLQPRLAQLRAFASYLHRPPGLPVVQNGDTWFYTRGTFQQSRAAVWQGQYYSQPVCNSPGCRMCQSIRQQLK